MIISNIKISNPYIKYAVRVIHFTARHSTAMEWIILETIKKMNSCEEYGEISVAEMFSNIFSITDADLLIKPCLISLRDMGAISFDNIDDKTELNNVSMKSLQLTSVGKKMQEDGLLPGKDDDDTIFVGYNDDSGELIYGREVFQYENEASGITGYGDAQNFDDTVFPVGQIRQLLETEKSNENGLFNWLMPTTSIKDITEIWHSIVWKNESKRVELCKDLVWHVVDNDSTKLDELALLSEENDCPVEFENAPVVNINNPDEQIIRITSIKEIKSFISEQIDNDGIQCYRKEFSGYIQQTNSNKSKKEVKIITNADEFAVVNRNNRLIIHVPEEFLKEETVYFGTDGCINVGKFNVKAGNEQRELIFAYKPRNNDVTLDTVIMEVVNKYCSKNYAVLFLLLELQLNELFNECVGNLIRVESSVEKKSGIIEQINSQSLQFYNRKVISSEFKEKLLVDRDYIKANSYNIAGASKIIKEYGAINAIKLNEGMFQNIIHIAMDSIEEKCESKDIWDFWENISNIKKSYIGWIGKNGLHRKLYSEEVIKEYIRKVESDEIFELKDYSVVEEVFQEMRRIIMQMEEILPHIDFENGYAREELFEAIVLNRENISNIYNYVRRWNDTLEKFNTRINSIDELMSDNKYLRNCVNYMKDIADVIKVFFDDSTLNYKNICIIDTCALENAPSIISLFEKGDVLLIIPQIVLSELDNHKDSTDIEKSRKAREVICKIDEYRYCEWLNLSEVSHMELIPKDIEPEKNDSRILSIAIKHILKKPTLITDDISLRNIAKSQNIDAMSGESYWNMKKHEEYSKGSKKSNQQKKKGKKKK